MTEYRRRETVSWLCIILASTGHYLDDRGWSDELKRV